MLLSLVIALAWAQPDDVPVRVVLDDRVLHRLVAPSLVIGGGPPVLLVDDGTVLADIADDSIYMAQGLARRDHSVAIELRDQGVSLGTLTVSLPTEGAAAVQLKLTTDGLALDAGAPPMGGSDIAGHRDGDNTIAVTVIVDDRSADRLGSAQVSVDQAGVAPGSLLDDGTLQGDVASDGVYRAVLDVARAEHLRLSVISDGATLGQVTVFLPSSSAATVRLITTDEGVDLQTEALATGGADGPVNNDGASVSADRLAHVLWVGIALFAVAFAWARRVVGQRWRDEVRPLLARLERFLDRQQPPV